MIFHSEINLSVKLEEDDVEPEPENKETEETPKAAQPQGRFSAPAFSNNLMADLGNFLKKSKKPESTVCTVNLQHDKPIG